MTVLGRTETLWPQWRERPLSAHLTVSVRLDTNSYKYTQHCRHRFMESLGRPSRA